VENSQRQIEVLSNFFFCCASPNGGERIAEPIVLAQYKGNERIGKAWTTIRSASPIVIEIFNLQQAFEKCDCMHYSLLKFIPFFLLVDTFFGFAQFLFEK
jgi:hypothetical protein